MPHEVHFAVPGGGKVRQLARYNYSPGDTLTDKNGFPLPKEILKKADLESGLNVSLPERSVVIFSSVK
jgi:hypothetical protein